MNPFRSLFLALSRMPPVMMLFIILGLAVVVTMYVMNILNDREGEIHRIQAANEAKNNAKVKVVYATRNIDQDEMISQESVEERDVEAARAPVDGYEKINAVVGQVAAYPIPAGTVVSNHALKPINLSNDFGSKIPEGSRAITFGVDTNSGVAGFIAPGSRVDVIAITGSGAETKADPVLSDVQVIAVGTTFQRAPGSTTANPAGSVTVCVTPDEGMKLVRSISATKLYLALRNDKDHSPVAVVDMKDLFPRRTDTPVIATAPEVSSLLPPPVMAQEPSKPTEPSAQNAVPQPPAMHEVELWSGSKRDVISLPQG